VTNRVNTEKNRQKRQREETTKNRREKENKEEGKGREPREQEEGLRVKIIGNNEREEVNFTLSYLASIFFLQAGAADCNRRRSFCFFKQSFWLVKKVYNVREVLGGESKKGMREVSFSGGVVFL
jgi:hypothetical protein